MPPQISDGADVMYVPDGWRLSVCPPKLPRFNRLIISPKTQPFSLGFLYSIGIQNPIILRLLSLVILVVPRHTPFDLLKVDVPAILGDQLAH